eukprot:jgi/Tetstr1/461119/TSEL_006258.t1
MAACHHYGSGDRTSHSDTSLPRAIRARTALLDSISFEPHPPQHTCPLDTAHNGSSHTQLRLGVFNSSCERGGPGEVNTRLLLASAAGEPETEKERSPLDYPQEWLTPQPSRRPDIFPEFEKLETPMPKPMPGDPEEVDDEEEEKKKKEKPDDPDEDDPEKEKPDEPAEE